MQAGAWCIYETNDDNEPSLTWARRSETTTARRFGGHAWMSTFRALSGELLWPQGFPLLHLHDPATWQDGSEFEIEVRSSVQQGMADGSPDVDAVWPACATGWPTAGPSGALFNSAREVPTHAGHRASPPRGRTGAGGRPRDLAIGQGRG